jgi:hypothetical protein
LELYFNFILKSLFSVPITRTGYYTIHCRMIKVAEYYAQLLTFEVFVLLMRSELIKYKMIIPNGVNNARSFNLSGVKAF